MPETARPGAPGDEVRDPRKAGARGGDGTEHPCARHDAVLERDGTQRAALQNVGAGSRATCRCARGHARRRDRRCGGGGPTRSLRQPTCHTPTRRRGGGEHARAGQGAGGAAHFDSRGRHGGLHPAGRSHRTTPQPARRLHRRNRLRRARRADLGLAVLLGSFWLFCLGTFFGGAYAAVMLSFRFAAADGVTAARRPRALSLVMAGGVLARVIGPQPVAHTMYLWMPHLFAATSLAQAWSTRSTASVRMP